MGSSTYSSTTYNDRVSYRALSSTPVFKYDADIRAGRIKASVEPTMNPYGVKIRESRDSAAHPITLPIAVLMDVTGSMGEVPSILEANLSNLMGILTDKKKSKKDYLGPSYPAIMIGAFDDYYAMSSYAGPQGERSQGTLQVGQFESGIEIDNDLEKLWLTGAGGGSYEESYELAMYFVARHTAHDNWEKRQRKAYCFLIGDEHPYPAVNAGQVRDIIGDKIGENIPLNNMLAELGERYHVFMIIPKMTQHYSDPDLREDWMKLLGQQNVLLLEEPKKICELVAATVALMEQRVGLDDLDADGVIDGNLRAVLSPIRKRKIDL